MAEAFLDQLLKVHNRVSSDEKHECIICKEDCGTKDRETGLLEFAVRLPFCKHIVGSACISQWLRSNNNCPICRHVFFPAQPRPYLEHGIMEGQAGHGQSDWDLTVREQITSGPLTGFSEFLTRIRLLCDDYCAPLGLQSSTPSLVSYLFAKFLEPGLSNTILRHHSDECLLAVSIYIISHLTGHPRSPREISAVVDNVDHNHLRATYNLLTNLGESVDAYIRENLIMNFNMQTLMWPPRWNEMTASESALQDVANLCSNYCTALGRPGLVHTMAALIASRAWNIGRLRRTTASPESLAAACMFMARHLMESPLSLSSTSQASHVDQNKIAEVYRALYAKRTQILQQHWLRTIGTENMERALARLPTL